MRRVTMKRYFGLALLLLAGCSPMPTTTSGVPQYRVDPSWPKALPEEAGVQLVVGQVSGIAVEEKSGHVWITHRPSTLLPDEADKAGKPVTHRCCKSLPAVAEFDAAGNYVRGW